MTKAKISTRDLLLASMVTALTVIFSQIRIPLPFTPIPVNLATMAVFLAGGLLGAYRGAASQIIFIFLGAVGLPVFTGFNGGLGVLVGPTGGYIAGYVAAAVVIGLIQGKSSGILRTILAVTAGCITIYTLGTFWFMVMTGADLIKALTMCVLPFIIGDILKITAAAGLINRLKRFI